MIRRFKHPLLAMFLAAGLFTSCDVLQEVLGNLDLPTSGLTTQEITQGLKEALKKGTNKAVKTLSAQDGFYKNKLVQIALPKEARVITQNLSKVPLIGEPLIEETKKILNRAAEDAASAAGPIFVNAITSMSISDAVGILKGNDTAATNYLRRTTYKKLKNAFTPKVKQSLGKKIVQNTSAEDAYSKLIKNYNLAAKVPFSGLTPIKTNTLSAYVTKRALNGLFLKVANEEKNIRDNPAARVTDILKKVFDPENIKTAGSL